MYTYIAKNVITIAIYKSDLESLQSFQPEGHESSSFVLNQIHNYCEVARAKEGYKLFNESNLDIRRRKDIINSPDNLSPEKSRRLANSICKSTAFGATFYPLKQSNLDAHLSVPLQTLPKVKGYTKTELRTCL